MSSAPKFDSHDVRGWFWYWIKRHAFQLPHGKWKAHFNDPRSEEFFEPWILEFQRKGVSYEEANAATDDLVEKDLGFPEKHLPALMRQIESTRRHRWEVDQRDDRLERMRAAARGETPWEISKQLWSELPDHHRDALLRELIEREPEIALLTPLFQEVAAKTYFDELRSGVAPY